VADGAAVADGCTVADGDSVADGDAVTDGAVGANDGLADGAVGPTDSVTAGEAAKDCVRAGDGGADRIAEGAPTCTLDNGAADDALNDSGDDPGDSDDLELFEQPASIPSTARPTPAHRRPRISLL
jgi:hypothetical protein